MTQEQVYIVLKTNPDERSIPTRDGDSIRHKTYSFGPDTVVGIFAQKDQAETEAGVHGEYKYAPDMDLGEPVPEVLIYTSAYESEPW